MPYKDPTSKAARESLQRRSKKYESTHREERKEQKRKAYWDDPEKERQRNETWRNKLKAEEKCVNCALPRDRQGKTLCSVCAPKFARSIKAYQDRTKLACFNAYGGCKCECCGESHLVFLSIDHINGGGGAHRSQLRQGGYYGGGGGWRMYRHLQKEGYPPGYRVLCFNCNQAWSVLGYCPHNPKPA